MASMDTGDGPSRSFRGGRGGGRGSFGGRGGRGYQGNNYQSDYQPGGRGGRGGRSFQQQQQQQQQLYSDGGRGQGRRGRGYWGNSRGGPPTGRGRGRGRTGGGRIPDPEGIQFRRSLKGHQDQVTAAVLDSATNQLYTGSQDGTVRVWNCETGECQSSVEVGGQVDSVLLEAGYLFVGMHQGQADGLIKVWNTATGAEQSLSGPKGQILSLMTVNGMLFSGSNDSVIHVWKFNAQTSTFDPMAALSAANGGHTLPVQAMVVLNQFMCTADWGGNIKVWDMGAGACVQTIEGAHDNVIMGLVNWQGHLVSCSLDSTIKIWQPVETPAPGAVLDIQPVYVHPPDASGGKATEFGGVLAIAGTLDGQQKPILLASHNEERVVRLWELPTFAERGELNSVHDARALTTGGPGYIVTGDKHGTVKMWQWLAS